ncbi:hypothetical protein FNU76_17595 [Chitinimonas arctica]|uniref:Uncharacterized protein n=1 Tax=Chitinimonas arctica TaxID=2594795 RepID=A0A516SIN5_9NEIS|nr:hypothetical protein [Chitinimonas arctica]QDQ28012.1 hypothetical protein FNU76_17595 [Chitinimonas arctica]
MSNKYQNITLQVSNAQPGSRIMVQLAPQTQGDTVAWSTGQPYSTSAGIQIQATSGTLPLAQFNVTASSVTFLTSSSGGGSAMQFNMQSFLVANETLQQFTLMAITDPNVQVTVSVNNGMPQTVNSSPSPFNWSQQ